LKDDPRYRAALSAGADPGRFAERLQAGGYATDPDYAGKIRAILHSPALRSALNGINALTGVIKS
jgi:flagellar protein FlgJ